MDSIREAAQLSREAALIPLVEDVAEWVTKITGLSSHNQHLLITMGIGLAPLFYMRVEYMVLEVF